MMPVSRFFAGFHPDIGGLLERKKKGGRRLGTKNNNTAISGTIWRKNGEHFEDLPGLNLDPYVEEFRHLSPLVISAKERVHTFPMMHFCVCCLPDKYQNYHLLILIKHKSSLRTVCALINTFGQLVRVEPSEL